MSNGKYVLTFDIAVTFYTFHRAARKLEMYFTSCRGHCALRENSPDVTLALVVIVQCRCRDGSTTSSSFFRLAPMRDGEGRSGGVGGPCLEGDITVVAGKSGGKWEIQRPGDKWLITAGERAARSARRYYEGESKGWGEYTAVIGQERRGLCGRETWDTVWCTWMQGRPRGPANFAFDNVARLLRGLDYERLRSRRFRTIHSLDYHRRKFTFAMFTSSEGK